MTILSFLLNSLIRIQPTCACDSHDLLYKNDQENWKEKKKPTIFHYFCIWGQNNFFFKGRILIELKIDCSKTNNDIRMSKNVYVNRTSFISINDNNPKDNTCLSSSSFPKSFVNRFNIVMKSFLTWRGG